MYLRIIVGVSVEKLVGHVGFLHSFNLCASMRADCILLHPHFLSLADSDCSTNYYEGGNLQDPDRQ